MKRIIFLFLAVPLMTMLCGCSTEPRAVTMHKPGVYKGDKDMLLALQNQQALIDRLMLTQTDR